MEFSWDENKRLRTIADRRLDFIGARRFFDGRPAIHQPSPRNDEDRWKTTAMIDDVPYTVIWLWRDEKHHIISMRRAHAKEIRAYRQLYNG